MIACSCYETHRAQSPTSPMYYNRDPLEFIRQHANELISALASPAPLVHLANCCTESLQLFTLKRVVFLWLEF